MKKVIIFFITLILFTITGCSNKDVKKHHYIFEGDNEYWTVVYEVTTKETIYYKDHILHCDSKSNETITATYKKDISDLSHNKNIEISYKNSVGGGKIIEAIDRDNPQKTFSMKSGSTNGALVSADEVIEVSINIDGSIQIIKLKNE